MHRRTFLTATDPDGRAVAARLRIGSGNAEDVTAAGRGKPLFGGERPHPPHRGAAMRLRGLTAAGMCIAYATDEIGAVEEERVTFRPSGDVAVVGRARRTGARVFFEGRRTALRERRPEFTVYRG
ncbi:hypothetical protein [Streptomyces cadmiisoli]|uniref:hypothetical protein n=1 Tax=Streptomyces cadmiisoli TaxID=2184053 RepID=UPI003D73C352